MARDPQRHVSVEKGLGPDGRVAVVRLDQAGGSLPRLLALMGPARTKQAIMQ
jgi:hypothetical protein